ncbi:hypothetical protein V1523DRAFT_424707 [Lipomyces doorenjongii]
MEKLVKDGKVRSIGVSNFTKEKLKELLRDCHAKKLAKEPAQVLISWAVQAELPSFHKVSLHHESNPISMTLCFRSTILPKISILEKNLRMNFPMRWGYDVFGEAGEEEVTKVAKKLAEERVKAKAARKYAWM